jgi:hypothetical protein
MNNWRTSVIGFVGGACVYLFGIGAHLPTTKDDAFRLTIAVVVAGLGLTAKDFKVTGGTVQATTSEGIAQVPAPVVPSTANKDHFV